MLLLIPLIIGLVMIGMISSNQQGCKIQINATDLQIDSLVDYMEGTHPSPDASVGTFPSPRFLRGRLLKGGPRRPRCATASRPHEVRGEG